jgi:hypothetical protein
MASMICHQTRPAYPIVNSQPMNQIGPMKVGAPRRWYQRFLSFSSAMFSSFYKTTGSVLDDFRGNILMLALFNSNI